MEQRQLDQTRMAFDSVAADYDGERGNNDMIQDMREEMWRWLDRAFPKRSALLDLGCGTGLDAIRMAGHGHHVTATDWSSQMTERTAIRAAAAGRGDSVRTLCIGAHELHRIDENGGFDGAYSNLGPLNCVPDLRVVSRQCARLLKPGGRLVFSVIGRLCPWEVLHYSRLGRWRRAGIRFSRGSVAVGMNKLTIWTRYYAPREFYRAFAADFSLEVQRGLCVFVPPPYLPALKRRHPQLHRALWAIDRRSAGWPLLRECGDHFLIILKKR